MKVWIPTKGQIEDMFWLAYLKLKDAKSVSEIEHELSDMVAELECHIANRSNEERKESHEKAD